MTVSHDDSIIDGKLIQAIIFTLNDYQRELAVAQIKAAFAQAKREVFDLHERTREGIQTARLAGNQIGAAHGKKFTIRKA